MNKDTIYRQDTIDAMCKLMNSWFGNSKDEQEEITWIINHLPSARPEQLWYWRTEMESCHRRMHVYKQGTEAYNHWKQLYESAVKIYNELSGMNLEVTE